MTTWYDFTTQTQLHLDEMRAMAAQDRLARQVRGRKQGRVRRRIGKLLIAAGVALIYQPLEMEPASPEPRYR